MKKLIPIFVFALASIGSMNAAVVLLKNMSNKPLIFIACSPEKPRECQQSFVDDAKNRPPKSVGCTQIPDDAMNLIVFQGYSQKKQVTIPSLLGKGKRGRDLHGKTIEFDTENIKVLTECVLEPSTESPE